MLSLIARLTFLLLTVAHESTNIILLILEKVETLFPDGSKEVKYSNGNTKIISPDGNCITVQYYNGDIKEINLQTNILKYFYSKTGTWHTQFGDGSELLEYARYVLKTKIYFISNN